MTNTSPKKEFNIAKTDEDQRLIFGWASVAVRKDGEQLIDHQKDMVDPEDLEEAVYEYVLEFRDSGEEHIEKLRKKARMVESVVFTKEKMKAMGIPEGTVPEGWWIGFHVDDDDAWAKVKTGVYKMFSIEGEGIRETVQIDEETAMRIGKSDAPTGCGVIVVKDGKLLTGTRIEANSRGQICGPGGHIEPGEDPEAAAIREAYEEFGIVCRDLIPLGIQDGGKKYGKAAVFLCTDFSGKPKTDDEEMTAAKWLEPSEIDEKNTFPPFLHSLELLQEEIEKAEKNYDEFPSFDMWLEENLDATIEEQKEAEGYYQHPVAKSFDEIMKFNPFHDSKGWFASSSGFASYSANPNTKAGAMAIARSAAAGHGKTVNVHRQSQGGSVRQDVNWLGGAAGRSASYNHLRRSVEPGLGLRGASDFGRQMHGLNQQASRVTAPKKKPAVQKPAAQQQTTQASQKPAQQATQAASTAAKPAQQTNTQAQTKQPAQAAQAATQQAQNQTAQQPQVQRDRLGFANYDPANYHALYNGRGYYQQQQLSAQVKASCNSYLDPTPIPGTRNHNFSQNMNQAIYDNKKYGTPVPQRYQKVYNDLVNNMHNIGYNINLTRYDHGQFLDDQLKMAGFTGNRKNLSVQQLKKTLVGQTYGDNRILSTSYNDFKQAGSSSSTFTSREVKITYRAKAGAQALMPGDGPGGKFGEMLLAPTGTNGGNKYKIVDVKSTGKMARAQGMPVGYNTVHQIEIVVEVG